MSGWELLCQLAKVTELEMSSGWELRRPVEAGRPSVRGWLADSGYSAVRSPVEGAAALAKVTELEMS